MPAAQPLTLSAAERWHMVQSVERGDAAQVMAMLELGFDPNMAYDPTDCRTLLSRAAVGKHAHIVRLLIEYGAEFDMERLGRDAASDANGQRGTNDAHGVNDDGGAELVAAALRGELDAARQQLIEECAAKEEQFGVLTSECASALEVSKHALEVALRKAAAATAQFERAGAEQARCRYCWRPATEAEPSASASANALVSADAEDAAAAAAAAATAARDPFRPPRGGGLHRSIMEILSQRKRQLTSTPPRAASKQRRMPKSRHRSTRSGIRTQPRRRRACARRERRWWRRRWRWLPRERRT